MHHAFVEALKLVNNLDDLESLRLKYLGKNGLLKQQCVVLSKILDPNEKKSLGKSINELKDYIVASLEERRQYLEKQNLLSRIAKEKIDVTLPSYPVNLGKVHVISVVIEKAKRILAAFGFREAKGPEIEDEYHVFDALNTLLHHPAREMQDSFYLSNGLVLRPHTSSVQVRLMENDEWPIRAMSVGKVYRNDWDPTHTPMFHQIEGLCIDESVNLTHLKYYVKEFLTSFFERELQYRFRPSFFPFTEPSLEVDILFEGKKWVEVLGCGMIHRNVLKVIEKKSKERFLTGFAFGMGIERLAMLYYGFSDIRKFYEGDIQWLNKNSNNII